jgi:hypothetical protein
VVLASVHVRDLDVQRLARGDILQAKDGDLIGSRDLVAVGRSRVLESKRQHNQRNS